MLILIKGRRHCSLRLVNPSFESMNEGDCYLLITPSKVFAWLGRYANALEKAKTMEIEGLPKKQLLDLMTEKFGSVEHAHLLLNNVKFDSENKTIGWKVHMSSIVKHIDDIFVYF